MQHIEELSQLLFPSRCFGCGEIGVSICTTCRHGWQPNHYLTNIRDLPVHSAVTYSPTASKILLAAKESGLKTADELIISALVHVLNHCNFQNLNIRLVPIPSSPSAQRRRGRSFIVEIAQKVALRSNLPASDSLELIRKVQDQSGLGAMARSLNMHGAFAMKSGAYPRGDLVLIDDVVTTGATLTEAARALASRGHNVLASVTACVAQPLR